MNIIERGRTFLQGLRATAERTVWDWRRCPRCGDALTCKWGSYTRRPWWLTGRQPVQVQRHWCDRCGRTYSEQSALLVRGGWYAREVRRAAIDGWQHQGTSVRKVAEDLRSWLGRQERWRLWRPLDPTPPDAAQCHLNPSTVERWLDGAGRQAAQTVAGQLDGIATSGQVGTDGLWARLRGGAKRVVLALTDSVSGLVWPPAVVAEEASAGSWEQLFARAKAAGLDLQALRGVTSDGLRRRLAVATGDSPAESGEGDWAGGVSGADVDLGQSPALHLPYLAWPGGRTGAAGGAGSDRSGGGRLAGSAAAGAAGTGGAGACGAGCQQCPSRRTGASATGSPSAGGRAGPGAGRAGGCGAGASVGLQPGTATGGTGMALAGLPAAVRAWTQSRVVRAAGAGGPALGSLSQL